MPKESPNIIYDLENWLFSDDAKDRPPTDEEILKELVRLLVRNVDDNSVLRVVRQTFYNLSYNSCKGKDIWLEFITDNPELFRTSLVQKCNNRSN